MNKVTYFFLTIFLAVCMIFPNISNAGGSNGKVDIEKLKKDLPHLFTNNNVGTDFWFTIPPCDLSSTGSNNYIRLFVTSPVATNCVMEIGDGSLYTAQMTVPNDVIMFVLDPSTGSVYTKQEGDKNVPEKVYPGKGIHVYADDPIVIYCAVRYQYTSDTWLCIPTAALGTEYIVASYPDMSEDYPGDYLPSLSGCTGVFDQTTVTFKLGGNAFTHSAKGLLPGQTETVILNQGDVFMMSTDGQEADLTGSMWSADKPISVVSGNFCANVPTYNRWCDYIAEMDIPTYQWGTDYFVTRFQPRNLAPVMRVFAKSAGTKVYNEGGIIGQFTDIPGLINQAYFELRLVPPGQTPHGVSVHGSAPIFVEEYNQGAEEDFYNNGNSDPFQLAVSPIQQFQKEVTFCTPGIRGLYGFALNYCNIVYECDSTGGVPDDLMWCQVAGGTVNWVPLKSLYPGTDQQFSEVIDGTRHFAAKQIKIIDAVYKVKCSKPFACYEFGFDYCDSYGNPTSFATIDLEHPDTNCPVPVYSVGCDGNVQLNDPGVGSVTDMPNNPAVRSNLAIIEMIKDSSFNYTFTVLKQLIPGTTITDTWSAVVQDPTQAGRCMIRFSDRVGNDTVITILYNPAQVEIDPPYYDFGHLKIGDQATMNFVVVNLDSLNPLNVKKLILDPNLTGFAEFSISNVNPALPAILPPGGKMTFNVTFTALADGSFADSIGVGDDSCYFFWKSYVQGSVGAPIIQVGNQPNLPLDADFGYQPLNKPNVAAIRVFNKGNAPLVVSNYSGPTNSVFQIINWSGDQPPTPANPWTIQPNTYKTFNVQFIPTAPITYNDTVFFYSDAQTIDSIAPITGTGTQATLFANSWDWGSRRIDRPLTFPIPAYPGVSATDSAIVLSNNGTASVIVSALTVEVNNTNGESFEFPNGEIVYQNGNWILDKTITIDSGGTYYIPVKFHPLTPANYELKFQYVNTAQSIAETDLKGIGIVGKISTADVDFGTTLAKALIANKRTVTFKNDPWQFQDSLTITSFNISNGTDINTVLTSMGTQGFAFDINAILNPTMVATQLPIVLQPGDSITISPAEFIAQGSGAFVASLTSMSDADTDRTSNWTGKGLSQGIETMGGTAVSCIGGTSAFIIDTIVNTGTDSIYISSINILQNYIDSINDYAFEFANPNLVGPQTLGVGDTLFIKIMFHPYNNIGNFKAIVETDNETADKPNIQNQISATSVDYMKTTEAKFVGASNIVNNLPAANVNSNITYQISLDQSVESAALANANSFEIKVVYPKNYLGVNIYQKNQQAYVNFNSDLTANNNWTIIPKDPAYDNSPNDTLTFYFSSQTSILDAAVNNLLSIIFSTYLPVALVNDSIPPLTVSHTVSLSQNPCLTVSGNSATCTLNPVCATPLRMVTLNPGSYYMDEISPNPVNSTGANLKFGLANDGYTEIKVINSNGEIVATPVMGDMKQGEWQITLPVTDLASGVYNVTLNSYPFAGRKTLVIVK